MYQQVNSAILQIHIENPSNDVPVIAPQMTCDKCIVCEILFLSEEVMQLDDAKRHEVEVWKELGRHVAQSDIDDVSIGREHCLRTPPKEYQNSPLYRELCKTYNMETFGPNLSQDE